MTKNKNENTIKLSFESDGKMGDKSRESQSKDKREEFFNITPESE